MKSNVKAGAITSNHNQSGRCVKTPVKAALTVANQDRLGAAVSMLIAAALALVPAVSLAGIPSPTSVAKLATGNPNPTVSPIQSKAHGKTYSEWSVLWWQFFLPLTNAEFANCTIGHSGNVAFLITGPATCTGSVDPGTALFFPVANVECSSLEAPPFHGDNPAERASCAASFIAGVGTLSVTLDGTMLQDLTDYHVLSPDFPFTVGPDNVFGITCASECSGKSSGEGYYLMLSPLNPGEHTIHISASGFGIDTTFTLRVGH
jgi:hypothetical protein